MTSLVIINLFIIIVAIVGIRLSYNKGLYLYSTVMIGISVPAVIIPFLLVLIGYESWRIVTVIKPEIAFNLQLNYLSFLLAFLTTYYFFNLVNKTEKFRIHNKSNKLFYFILVILGLSLYSYYIYSIGIFTLSSDIRTAKYYEGQGLGLFEYGINLLIISVICAEFFNNTLLRYIGRIIGLTIIYWSIFVLGIRTYPGIIVVSWLFIYASNNNVKIITVRNFLILILLIYVFNAIAIMRSFPREIWLENINVIFSFNWPHIIGTLDHSNSYINFYEIVTMIKTEGNIDTYLKAFTNLIPSQIYNSGHGTPSEIFTSYLYPDIFDNSQ